jgi:SAM-dependent methyltransferase
MSSASATPVPAAPSPAADTGTLPRPGRATVVTLYDRGVDAYVNLWSSVILPAAHAVVAAMDLEPSDTVIDVGGGSGAVIPAIRDACPAGAARALDASFEMLRVARDRADASVAQSDALALPIRDGTADAVLLAFVLFHVLDPIEALGEAARALRVGGRVGTATWAQSHEPSPAAVHRVERHADRSRRTSSFWRAGGHPPRQRGRHRAPSVGNRLHADAGVDRIAQPPVDAGCVPGPRYRLRHEPGAARRARRAHPREHPGACSQPPVIPAARGSLLVRRRRVRSGRAAMTRLRAQPVAMPAAGPARAGTGRVGGRMRTATTTPERTLRIATAHTAARMSKASATIPPTIPPTT